MRTAAVRLRAIRESDAGAAHRLLSDPDVLRYMTIPVQTEEEARAFVAEGSGQGGGEVSLSRAIVFDEREEPAGFCGLVRCAARADAEAWYLVDPAYRGRGIATEGLKRLLDFGFELAGTHRIWATVRPENPASARVLEKCGFRREGYLLKAEKFRDGWQDVILYAILREEWRGTGVTNGP